MKTQRLNKTAPTEMGLLPTKWETHTIDNCGTDKCGTDNCGTDNCGTDNCGTNNCGTRLDITKDMIFQTP